MSDTITEKVIELAAEHGHLPAEQISAEHHFVNDLNFDSLERVEFAMDLEDEFELSVPDENLDQFQTVGQVIDFVRQNVKDTPPSQNPQVSKNS